MTLDELRREVLEANRELIRRGLVLYTFGNASGLWLQQGLVVIKPSGVPFEELTPEQMVVTDLDGRVVEGRLRPSSDLPTHLEIYRAFGAGGVVHTHSTYATAWAQAGREIPCYGTTQADYCRGPVPVTAPLEAAEIAGDYERNTGRAIVRRFRGLNPREAPWVLVHGHGPFTWGATPSEALFHAVILEEVARLAWLTVSLNPAAEPLPAVHIDRHFLRKHGPQATYGQTRG
jgi:L-ribulose-5-phosphate 4-epimerase